MTVEAMDRNEAISKLKGMMGQGAIDAHMKEKHPGKPTMSVAECHAMIEKDVVEA